MPTQGRKMGRRQRDHILAKREFNDMLQLAKDRNPKLCGEHPSEWTPAFSYVQGYLSKSTEDEKLGKLLHKQLEQLRDALLDGANKQSKAELLARLFESVERFIDPPEAV